MTTKLWLAMLVSIHLSACASQAAAQGDSDNSGGPAADADQDERDTWLAERIETILGNRVGMSQARVGLLVQDADSGRVIIDERGDQASHVASNVKILTTAAVLSGLGPNFRYRTSILAERIDDTGAITGDLYLRGRGDPVLRAADLGDMADDLVLMGITAVRGRVIVDDSYFNGQITPPHFDEYTEALDQHAAFRAPVAALTVNRGTFSVIIAPARSGDGPAHVSIDPPSDYIQVSENQVMTQRDARERINLSIERPGTKSPAGRASKTVQVQISGQIQMILRPRRFTFRVEDPALHAGFVLRHALVQRGIQVRRQGVERGLTPPGARVLATAVSQPLAVLVRRLGKRSDNAVAEALLATLGAEKVAAREDRPATWADGVSALRGFLIREMGFPDAEGGFQVENGSGLYGDTRISPAQLVKVLRAAYHDPRYGPDFMASLAIAGVDGTLRRRMKNSRARGMIRAKTGTLGSVSALSGYARVPGGNTLVFSMVVSELPDTGASKKSARRYARFMQNHVAEALIHYLESAAPATPARPSDDSSTESSDDAEPEQDEPEADPQGQEPESAEP